MYAFIDEERVLYGVEPICRVLAIAPSGYYTYRARQADPTQRPARAQRDDVLREQVHRVWECNRGVYGVRKVWQQLLRDGQTVARCTVARLMAAEGLRGVVRGQRHRTTIADTTAELAQDLVQRQFHAERPNHLWVADFTYVATWRGFVYVAFVIDVFSRRIVGWRAHNDADRSRTRRVGAGLARPSARWRSGGPLGPRIAIRLHALHRPPGGGWRCALGRERGRRV